MKKYIRCFKYIMRHKWYVLVECWKRGLYWQGIAHDYDKFLLGQFIMYSKYFHADDSPNTKGYTIKKHSNPNLCEEFNKSRLSHIHRHKHHWEHWCLVNKKGIVTPLDVPKKYVLEMICDWISVGKVLRGKEDNVWNWWADQNRNLILSELTRSLVWDEMKSLVDEFIVNLYKSK